MSEKMHIHIGASLRAGKRRVLNAVARAKRGETVIENHLTFESWTGLSRVMTEKRYELLRHLHKSPAPSVRALSKALGRDYRRVHEDVDILTAAGLVERDGQALHADYSVLQATIPL